MDLRNLCSKLDVDALRAKIPPLPEFKLPKSMLKLKSRKIFRSSREDVNSVSRRASSKSKTTDSENLQVGHTISQSEFIKRTPNHISTISSLMTERGDSVGGGVSTKLKSKNADSENFYRSAGGIEDYYPSPMNPRFEQHISRPISPVTAPPITPELRAKSEQNIKMSFGERLQKGYKDVTEFKVKHLFAKKTVIRTDKIEITEYINQFDKDRKIEENRQEKLDQNIADNYNFQFKVSQQKSEDSCIDSPASTPREIEAKRNLKTVSELSGDESGMDSTPPPRKPGIASTRFSRVRSTPLNMPMEEYKTINNASHMTEISSNSRKVGSSKLAELHHSAVNSSVEGSGDERNGNIELDVKDENSPKIKPNVSSLYDVKKSNIPEKCNNTKRKSIKERVGRFTKHNLESGERKDPLSSQQAVEDSVNSPKADKAFGAIKENFRKLQKSVKLPHQTQSGDALENDDSNPQNKTTLSRTQQFTERIKRFRSTDQINKTPEDDDNKESPIHKISNKLQAWKKSMKKKVDNEDDYAASSPQRPVDALMKKIKHIRSRKRDSTDDPDDDEEGGETYKESLSARAKLQLEKGVAAAGQMPQKTIKRLSDTKNYFKKKPENVDKNKTDDEEEENEQGKICTKSEVKGMPMPHPPPPRPATSIPRPYVSNSSGDEESDEKQKIMAKSTVESQLISVPTGRAIWTTKPSVLSDDTIDYDDELPRVLLHQDNSDVFESTLIIAVTRPITHTTTPIITELPPDSPEESISDTKPSNWTANEDLVASFLEMTPPSQQKYCKDFKTISNTREFSRKHSIDSSSEDSWIKNKPCNRSTAFPNTVRDNEEPWKIGKINTDDNFYKRKSIDLFELQQKHGGMLNAFEDFDDELKNTPVVKIGIEISANTDSYDRESSEELDNPDDDNSSRVTKISIQPADNKTNQTARSEQELRTQKYANSREILGANFDDKSVVDSGGDDGLHEKKIMEQDRPPSNLSPPASISPTLPPFPQRQSSIIISKLNPPSLDFVCATDPPPPLPLTKPPLPSSRPVPPLPPPKIPDRNSSTTRISKPLVKTGSLRLAYNEQVNPQDIGKVNKLISRFEPDAPKQKPRLVSRMPWPTNDSEEYSDDEGSFEILPIYQKRKAQNVTPTNHSRIQKTFSIDSADLPNSNEKLPNTSREIQSLLPCKETAHIIPDKSECATPVPTISISSTCLDVNSNFSQPSSEYGSPLPYPSSTVGSTQVTPLTNRKTSDYLGTRRNRRSLARDDEHFYSFDSDEENSYYSISSTSSNRYVVEL